MMALPLCLLFFALLQKCLCKELKADIEAKHAWQHDPIHLDHGFIHHMELFDTVRHGKSSFEAFDVFHVKGDEKELHPFLNLGDLHKTKSVLYDTKTSYVLEKKNSYIDLDHVSNRVSSIDDSSMRICNDDEAGKIQVGSYLIGTGAAEWINQDHVVKWMANTNHVGPRVKRKLADSTAASLGLVLSRVVKSMKRISNSNCVELSTETIHPNSMFETMKVESLFHAHSAHEASRFNKDNNLEESMHYDKRAKRQLAFLVDGNGVQYCDDTVEKNQEVFMTKGYNQWSYDKRSWGWYKGKFDVPTNLGGGEVMYLASLLSNGGSGCFMYMNTLEAFNWNTDVSDVLKPKADTNPYILAGTSESGILCENCFAYLGAKVRVVAEFQKKNSEVRFLAFVGGTSASFAGLQVNNYMKAISRSGSFIFPQPESAYKDVAIGNTGIKFYWKGGGFGYELDGEVETQGQVRASAGIYADAYIYAAYGGKGGAGETFYVNKSASIDYHLPSIETSSDFKINQATVRVLLTGSINMKIGRSLKVFGRELGITSMFTSSLRKEVTLDLKGQSPAPIVGDFATAATSVTVKRARTTFARLVRSSSRTLSSSQHSAPTYQPGDRIVVEYEYTGHSSLSEQEVFVSLITGGRGETPVTRKSFTTSSSGSGQVTVEILVPWNKNFQGGDNSCHLILRSSADDALATKTEDFYLEAFTERDSIFTAPASLVASKHNEELRAGTLYTVRWDKSLLWHYRQEPHQLRHGEHWEAEQVTFELVGESMSAGEVMERTRFTELGVHPNAGYATITFPPQAASITQGHRFYLVIKAVGASYLQGWSSGYFRFYQGSDEVSGLPLVSIQTMGIDAAFRQPSKHKVDYLRSFLSPQDFAAAGAVRAGRGDTRRLQVNPVGPQDGGTDVCEGITSTDMNFAMSGRAGVESLVGSIDFTSNMVVVPLGQERSKCVTDMSSTVIPQVNIPVSQPVDLDPEAIPSHKSVEPVPAPKVNPPPLVVPSPPNATELKGWLVTKIYPDCIIADSEPEMGQIMMKAEAVGLCIRVGESGNPGEGIYLMNDVVPGSSETHTWFFSGPDGAHCTEEALIADDDGDIKYQVTDIRLGECVKLGSSSQLHYSITTFMSNTSTSPVADFGIGSGTVYWDVQQNCESKTNITSFSITNPNQCYAVQSIASLDSRQIACSSSGGNITTHTYYSSTDCTSGSNKVVSTIPFKTCAPSDAHLTTSFGQTGYLPSADNYKSNFCSSQVPYTKESTEDNRGGSSGGVIREDTLSGGAIAGIIVMVVTIILCIAMVVHYAKAKKNPFNLWGDDDHDPTLRNWLSSHRRSSTSNTSDAAVSGLAVQETTRETTVITIDTAYPENRDLSATDITGNPLHDLTEAERRRMMAAGGVAPAAKKSIPRLSLMPAAAASASTPASTEPATPDAVSLPPATENDKLEARETVWNDNDSV